MNYTVQGASKKKDIANGLQVVALTLVEEGKDGVVAAEWVTKDSTPLPQSGSKLEGDLEQGPYGLKFKKAGGFGGGGGGGRKESPETRRSIAMQASQKVAVDAVSAAMTAGLWKPEDPGQLAPAIIKVADRLYLRVLAAERDEVKA